MPVTKCPYCNEDRDDDLFKSKKSKKPNKKCRLCLNKVDKWREQNPSYINPKWSDADKKKEYYREWWRNNKSVSGKFKKLTLEDEEKLDKTIKSKVATHKAQDSVKGKYSDITVEHVVELLEECRTQCSICGCQLKLIDWKSGDKSQFSVDRIDGSLGHRVGNCIISCYGCNLAKKSKDIPLVRNEVDSLIPRP